MKRIVPGNCRRGSVLILSLILTFVAMMIAGAMSAYYVHTARLSRMYFDRSVAMIEGAQQGIDQYVLPAVEKSLESLNAGGGGSLVEALQTSLQEYMGGKSVAVGDYDVELKVLGLNDATKLNNAGGVLTVEAVVKDKDGNELTTLQEYIRISGGSVTSGSPRSHPVFNYGYFVDRDAVILSTAADKLVINGEVGANGKVTIGAATINGMIHARGKSALNSDAVDISSSSVTWTRTYYEQQNYEVISNGKESARPTNPVRDAWSQLWLVWEGGYRTPEGTSDKVALTTSLKTKESKENVVAAYSTRVELPKLVAKASDYVDLCEGKGGKLAKGKLKCTTANTVYYSGKTVTANCFNGYYKEKWTSNKQAYHNSALESSPFFDWKTTTLQTKQRTITSIDLSNGHWTGFPFKNSDSVFDDVARTIEKGSLILIGTYGNPIDITGPVYVDGDVIIKGYVTGQGAIYAKRNVHIIGDIIYKNPPTWPHGANDAQLKFKGHSPNATRDTNKTCDMLALYARGSIIVGNYTKSEWVTQNQNWLKLASRWATTYSSGEDMATDIGYPRRGSIKFLGDYSDYDGTNKVALTYPQTYAMISSNWSGGENYYYKRSTSIEGSEDWTGVYKIYTYPYYLYPCTAMTNRRYYESVFGDFEINALSDSKVEKIDACLVSAHGLFGTAEQINGSIIARDEGLLLATAAANKSLVINCDIRFNTGSAEGVAQSGVTAETPVDGNYQMSISGWQIK